MLATCTASEVATNVPQYLVQGDKRPHVNLTLKSGKRLRALIDTGAQISCISETDFFNLQEPMLHSKQHGPVKGVSGNMMQIIGSTQVSFQIDNVTSACEFSVVKGFKSKPILGCDWLESNNVNIECSKQGNCVKAINNIPLESAVSSVIPVIESNVHNRNSKQINKKLFTGIKFKSWKSDLIENIRCFTNSDTLKAYEKDFFFASAVRETIVEPMSVRKVEIIVNNVQELEPECDSGIIDNFSTLISDLSVIPSQVTLGHSSTAHIFVANTGYTSKIISRRAKVGIFESSNEVCSQKLSSEYLHSLKMTLQQSTRVEQSSRVPQVAQNTFEQIPKEKQDLIEECLKKTNLPSDQKSKLRQFLTGFHDIIAKDAFDIGKAKFFNHKILPKTNEPVFRKQFRIADCHHDFINEYVSELLKMGVIRESSSPYNAPIFVVKKKADENAKLTQKFRLVNDLRALNNEVFEDRYSIREVNQCIAEIGKRGSKIFTAIDLVSSFWQLPLHESSMPLTAFTVPGKGHFEFTRAPMGLNSSPAGFSRVIDSVFRGLLHTACFIDDILVHSTNFDNHLKDLAESFSRLRFHGFKINLLKCSFCAEETNYLGFRLTKQGILPGKDKVKAISQFPMPDSIKTLRSFLGLVNYFRGHIANYTQIAGHLTVLLRKDSDWKGGPLPDKAKAAFQVLKTALSSEPVMAYPQPNSQFILTTDAATGTDEIVGGFGAVLSQNQNGEEKIIAYASRALRNHEKNYSPFLAEMAASVYGIEEFSHFLKGRKFTLRTDHKPLEKLSTMHKKTLSRLGEIMNEYHFSVEYLPGPNNVIADALSRNPLPVEALAMDQEELSCAQMADPLLCDLFKFVKFGKLPADRLQAEKIKRLGLKAILDDNILYVYNSVQNVKVLALCVPKQLTHELMKAYHTHPLTGHKSFDKTLLRIQSNYFWPTLTRDVRDFCQSCFQCQLSKMPHQQRVKLPLHLPEIPDAPNVRVHSDLFGPLKASEGGHKYIITFTDSFSKLVELTAIPDKSAPTVAKAFYEKWICRYGAPIQFVSDQGREFTNSILTSLCHLLNITKSRTSAYCPQSNGQAEVFNKEIRKYLTCFLENKTLDWEELLPPLAFSYNTCINKATAQTPFFLTYLHQANMPFDLLHPKPLYTRDYAVQAFRNLQDCYQKVMDFNATYREGLKRYFDLHTKEKLFSEGQQVLVYFPPRVLQGNVKFIRPWKGPYYVTKILGETNIEIKKSLSQKKGDVIHVNRAKHFVQGETYTDADLSQSVKRVKDQVFLRDQIDDSLESGSSYALPDRVGDNRSLSHNDKSRFDRGVQLSHSPGTTNSPAKTGHPKVGISPCPAESDILENQNQDIPSPTMSEPSDSDSGSEEEEEIIFNFQARQPTLPNENRQESNTNHHIPESSQNTDSQGPAFNTRRKYPNLTVDMSIPSIPIERRTTSKK